MKLVKLASSFSAKANSTQVKEIIKKNSADKLKLLKRPKLKAKKSKNVFPNNFKFIPLSKVFEMTERKPDLGGPDDQGSSNRDKRRGGAG